MKTTEEIDDLKRQWCENPCWDIENTEGFENHHDELLAYRKEHEKKQDEEFEQKVRKEMSRLGITDRATYNYLKWLEGRIDKIESILEKREIY